MADNYQLFSEAVSALTPAERQWLKRVLECDEDREQVLREAGLDLEAIDTDDWPGFAWQLDDGDADLWLYSEDCGNVSHAGEFVRAFLSRFRPAECWSLTWAETCSKPRIGEFAGGALFVTARSVRAFNAADWLERHRRSFQRRSPAVKRGKQAHAD